MRNKSKVIGFCGSYLFNQLPIQFIKQLRQQGLQYGYHLIALSCGSDSAKDTDETIGDQYLIDLIRYIPLTGMVVLSETIKNPTLLEHIRIICREKNIPVFSIDASLDGCYNMISDNAGGFEQMVRHVVEFHGCRKVNMLAGWKGDFYSEQRVSVFKKVLEENSIPIEEERIKYADFWDIPARKAVREFMKSPLPVPEAIVCANDSMAIAACAELQKFGYSVPEDIIITGFDGIQSGQNHFPVLTTCEPDFQEAASFIVHELEKFNTNQYFKAYDHPFHFIPKIQQSCGCKPKTFHNLNQVISTLYENLGDSAWHSISMNQLISANLNNESIPELSKILPEHVNLWKSYFRFSCVKSSMFSSCKVEDNFTNMVSILDIRSGNVSNANKIFPIEEFIPNMDDIENADTFIVRLLNSGKTVYGYNVEGFQEIDERGMQRCNDFAFFLSYCLNTVVHNAKQKELTEGLIKANHEISMMSLHDPMTGLFNRRGFYHCVEKILKDEQNAGKYLYIFSIDMNHLKYINDTFGHSEGDFAITTLSQALLKVSGSSALCARFGGDEFVVVIPHADKDAYTALEFYNKILNEFASANVIYQKPYKIEASVGMSYQEVSTAIDIEALLAEADKYMYQMKHGNTTKS